MQHGDGLISIILLTLPIPQELELPDGEVVLDFEYSTNINGEPEMCERIGLARKRAFLSITTEKHFCSITRERLLSRRECEILVNGFAKILLKKNRGWNFYAWNAENAEVKVFKSFGVDPAPTINELMPDNGPKKLDDYIQDRRILERFPHLKNWRSREFLTRIVNDCSKELESNLNDSNDLNILTRQLTHAAYGSGRRRPNAGEIVNRLINLSVSTGNETIRLYTSIVTSLRNYVCIHAAVFRYHEMRKNGVVLKGAIGKLSQTLMDDFLQDDFLEILTHKPSCLLVLATMFVNEEGAYIISPLIKRLHEFQEFTMRIDPSIDEHSREVIDLIARLFDHKVYIYDSVTHKESG
jgi:hypothetical protein